MTLISLLYNNVTIISQEKEVTMREWIREARRASANPRLPQKVPEVFSDVRMLVKPNAMSVDW